MERPEAIRGALLLLGVVAALHPGCTCGNRPAPITPPPVTPETTGAKVNCACTIAFSQTAQDRAGLPAMTDLQIQSCLPANFAMREQDFCAQAVQLFVRDAAEQVALAFKPGLVPVEAVCGGLSIFGSFDPAVSSVVCEARPFPNAGLAIDEPQCQDVAGGPGRCEAVECQITGTTNPDGTPAGGNCLVQPSSISLDRCNCTVAVGCNERSAPVCALKPGTADPPVLTTSPMTALTSRLATAMVDSDQSRLDINVEVQLFCVPIVGCATVSDSAQPRVEGFVNVYGGPCPGASCNILLDGALGVEDFTLSFSTGPFSETHTISQISVRLGAGDTLLTVGPDGNGTIPAGVLSFVARGADNGAMHQQTDTNPMPVPFHIDWAGGVLRLDDVQASFGGNSRATLDLVAHLGNRLVDEGARFIDWDSDLDGVPDRLDNCPAVPNPGQIPVPPALEVADTVRLSTCTPGTTSLSVPVPVGRSLCLPGDLPVTGEIISAGGRALVPPIPIVSGSVTVRPGVYRLRWTTVDSTGISTTREQTLIVEQAITEATCCLPGQRVVLGTEGGEVLSSGPGAACVFARGGGDNVHTGPATDFADLGAGGDVFSTPAGDDVVLGGPEGDVISFGQTGRVRAFGGDGDDVLDARFVTAAELHGGAGSDQIVGSGGADVIVPGPGADVVTAGEGDDRVSVYDVCELGRGKVLAGGAGNDTLRTPVDAATLAALGVTVSGFESIVVDAGSRHLAECF